MAILGLGVGSFVPSALALMADSSEPGAYGATMGLYSFALGFGALIAESIGLSVILLTGNNAAPGWLLYFAAVLVAIAVILMFIFFIAKWLMSQITKP